MKIIGLHIYSKIVKFSIALKGLQLRLGSLHVILIVIY